MTPADGEQLPAAYTEAQTKSVTQALAACLAVQRTYGKQAADLEQITKIFIRVLADYPAEDVIRAIRDWILQSPEFPTPSDIRSILEPEDEPKREIYQRIVATMRQGQGLQDWEWDYLKRYERENR